MAMSAGSNARLTAFCSAPGSSSIGVKKSGCVVTVSLTCKEEAIESRRALASFTLLLMLVDVDGVMGGGLDVVGGVDGFAGCGWDGGGSVLVIVGVKVWERERTVGSVP